VSETGLRYLKTVCTVLAALLVAVPASAVENQGKYSVSVMGMYGWNETWRSHGGVDVIGFLPVSRHFEANAAMEAHSPKTFAATLNARPKFHLPVGELFLEGTFHFRNLGSYGIADLDLAASLGYRMDYVSAQVGVISHFTLDTEKGRNISEPLNLLYRIAVNVRPYTSRWNIGAGAANFTDFEYERSWEPMYFLIGHYDINERMSVLARADLKPAGAFHLTAGFWGIAFRAGLKISF